MLPEALPLPRGGRPEQLEQWGRHLVDVLRRQKREDLEAAAASGTDLTAVQAALSRLQTAVEELQSLLAGIDADLLASVAGFNFNLLEETNAFFGQFREELAAALKFAHVKAETAIRDGILANRDTAAIRTEQRVRREETFALANQVTVLEAQIGDAQGAIVIEQTARTDGDEALAQELRSLLARVGQAEAAIDDEVTVRATHDSAIAQAISTLSTSIGGQEISVSELKQSIDGLYAQWGISITANGEVIGLVSLAGDKTKSTFTVVADNFLVAAPGAAGVDPKLVFGIGTVDGVTTIGIRGNVLLDGTVTARSLNVGTLAAITANLGTVTAGRIESDNGLSFWDLNTGEFKIASA